MNTHNQQIRDPPANFAIGLENPQKRRSFSERETMGFGNRPCHESGGWKMRSTRKMDIVGSMLKNQRVYGMGQNPGT